MSRAPQFGPVAVKIGTVARMLDSSTSTIRRLQQSDLEFPRPFRLSAEGDWLWLLDDIRGYIARKSGRQLAA